MPEMSEVSIVMMATVASKEIAGASAGRYSDRRKDASGAVATGQVDGVQLDGMAPSRVLSLLVPPNPKVPRARNDTPVIVVHGTMTDKKSIEPYLGPVLDSGHYVKLDTYTSIKEGAALEESGQVLSRDINDDRLRIARWNVDKLKACEGDMDRIKSVLAMDGTLYGPPDPAFERVTALLPRVIDRIDGVLDGERAVLLETFSRKMARLEEDLGGQVEATGFAADVADATRRQGICQKVAAEIMDSIVPKAILLGHSMGGFVSYVLAVNPKDPEGTGGSFTYDAGNGISTVMTLSSPIKSGVATPLPPALTHFAFDTYEKTVLAPMEATPGMQFARLNPAFAAWYDLQKEMTRSAWAAASNGASLVGSPLVYLTQPGVREITQGSRFIHEYVEGHHLRPGITGVAFSCQGDGISPAERSTIDDTQMNAFNVKSHVEVTPELLKQRGATFRNIPHIRMAKTPLERGEEFRRQVLENPSLIPKVLDRSNYDGVRWQCASVLLESALRNPERFRTPEMAPVVAALEEVASERLPFKDSPSYLARQILDELARSDAGTHDVPDEWAIPGFARVGSSCSGRPWAYPAKPLATA